MLEFPEYISTHITGLSIIFDCQPLIITMHRSPLSLRLSSSLVVSVTQSDPLLRTVSQRSASFVSRTSFEREESELLLG